MYEILPEMIITRPTPHRNTDLLSGREHDLLEIRDLEGNLIQELNPSKGGWTHEMLEAIDYSLISPLGWVVYLGGVFIGSSEQVH